MSPLESPTLPITTRELLAAGHSERSIASQVRAGTLRRIRPGWFALLGCDVDVERAVRAGGSVTCVTALRKLGIWTLPDDRLHVAVVRGAQVTRSAFTRLHWVRSRRPLVVPVEDALDTALRCLPRRDAVVVIDSVINQRVLREEVATAIAERTARGRDVVRLMDPASQSGTESIVRLALIARGIQVRSQVQITGVGRVDLVIGDRLVLEVDGRSWHDRPGDFDRDRARDRALIAAGYIVMRMSYRQVMDEWPAIEAQILLLVRRREHLWRSAHTRLGHVAREYRR